MLTERHKEISGKIWEIANRLRGPYRPPQYRLVMCENASKRDPAAKERISLIILMNSHVGWVAFRANRDPITLYLSLVISIFCAASGVGSRLGAILQLWISESGNKVIQRDDQLAQALGLKIETDKLLPDTILVDLAPAEPLIVFVEAVATAGEISETRRGAFIELMTGAGFKANQIAFVTAFEDRNAVPFKRAIPNLAWGSFAWCLSEPEHLIVLDGTEPGGVRLLTDFAV